MDKITHKVVFTDGNLAEVGEKYRVLATTVMIWDTKQDYTGGPVEQTGITFTHTVSKGD